MISTTVIHLISPVYSIGAKTGYTVICKNILFIHQEYGIYTTLIVKGNTFKCCVRIPDIIRSLNDCIITS